MSDYLLICIGIIGQSMFVLRFLIQWMRSERAGKVVVGQEFWILSIIGNILMYSYAITRHHWVMCLGQYVNAIISIRNIAIISGYRPLYLLSPVKLTLWLAGFLCLLLPWITIYSLSYSKNLLFNITISDTWHIVGLLGIICFNARFWIQWIQTEYYGKSELKKSFWIFSILGSIITTTYAIFKLRDIIWVLAYATGLFIYARSLFLSIKNGKRK